VRRYPEKEFEIETMLFRRTRGEARLDAMSEEEAEAHDRSLHPDELHDYIQEGVYAKELAGWIEAGLGRVGLAVEENFAEDFGRLLILREADRATVLVVCSSLDGPNDTSDGHAHIITVSPKPRLKARVFHDAFLESFAARVFVAIEQLILNTPEIKLVRKV
jgi:hypothetical protein